MPSISQKYRAAVAGISLVLAAPAVLAKPTVKTTTGKQQIVAANEEKTKLLEALREKEKARDEAEEEYQFALARCKGEGIILDGDLTVRYTLKKAAQGDESAIGVLLSLKQSNSGIYSRETHERVVAFLDGYVVASKKYSKKPIFKS